MHFHEARSWKEKLVAFIIQPLDQRLRRHFHEAPSRKLTTKNGPIHWLFSELTDWWAIWQAHMFLQKQGGELWATYSRMGTEEKACYLSRHELWSVWFIWIKFMSCVYNLLWFFFFEGAIIDWPIINCFWNMGALPNRSNSLDPSGKIEIAVHPYGPTFSVYLHENWTLGNPYGKNLRCYWELLMRELLGNLRNHMRTWWERNGNKKKNKNAWVGGCVCMFVGGQKIYSERKRENTKKAVTFWWGGSVAGSPGMG